MRSNHFNTCLVLLFIVLASSGLYSQEKDDLGISLKRIEKRAYDKYISDKNRKDFRFTSSKTISDQDSYNGNIIVVDGNLRVDGEVDGDILVILGNVNIRSNAVIYGNVTAVNGRIRQSERSIVKGNQVETKVKNLFPRYAGGHDGSDFKYFDRMRSRYREAYSTLPLGKIDETILLNYNRVQGLFLGVSFPKYIRGKYNLLTLHGFAGYGFKEKEWGYKIGADRWLFDQRDFRFELGAAVYDYTDSKDDWIISDLENSLAAFLIHEDFQDFYRRKGFELHASQNLSIFFKGSLIYRDDRYQSVFNNVDWALFGGDKKFRLNPGIDEGRMRSLYGELYFDTRDNQKLARSGWLARLGIETSNTKLNSDFSFNQYLFEVRRYQKLGRFERLDIRLKAITSEGRVPLQKLYQLGGISTLRAFSYKSVRGETGAPGGDRLLLGNIEYNVSPNIFNSDFLFFDEFRYILFFDIGNVWNRAMVSSRDDWRHGFSQLKLSSFKSDIGIAISSWSGRFRFGVAKRLDSGKDAFAITFRVNKPF